MEPTKSASVNKVWIFTRTAYQNQSVETDADTSEEVARDCLRDDNWGDVCDPDNEIDLLDSYLVDAQGRREEAI